MAGNEAIAQAGQDIQEGSTKELVRMKPTLHTEYIDARIHVCMY